MVRLRRYSKLPVLRRMLKARCEAARGTGDPIFMLPSMANEELLLDALSGEGGYFAFRPEVWSWAALYRAVVPPPLLRRQVDPPDHRMILNFILKRTLGELDRAGVSVPRGVRRGGFTDLLSASIRELLLEDVSPDRLLPRTSEAQGDVSLDSRALLYRLYSDYLIYLEENGLADNAQLPILARLACAEGCGELRGRTMLWVGFLSFTGAQIKLIRALERNGVGLEFFVPDAGLGGFYDAAAQLGLEHADSGEMVHSGGIFATLMARDRYGQFDGIAREIARARAGEGGFLDTTEPCRTEALDDIGILTDSADLPLIASALERCGIAWESRAELPVSESVLIRVARGVWDAHIRDWPTRRTLHLLSSPVFGLVGLDGERIAAQMPEGWRAWREAAAGMSDSGKTLALLDQFKKFCDFVDAPEGHTGEELLRALLTLAEEGEWELRVSREVADDLSLDSSVREVASSRMEVEQKLELLRELRPVIGEAGEGRLSGAEAMAFIASWSREATTALPQPISGAVRLYDAPPPVLASHRLWIMTGVTAARYPGAATDASLLGAEVRESVNGAAENEGDAGEPVVHLPTLHEKREQKEALFRRLLAVGEDFTLLTRSANDLQGRPQGDSPFLISLLADRTSGWERCGEILIPDLFAGEGDARPARGAFPRVGVLRREKEDGKLRVRLSEIDAWRSCPFLYWCGLMGLEPPRDVTGVIGALERGNLIHELWQRVWSAWTPDDRTPLSVAAARAWSAMLEEGRRAGSAAAEPRASAAIAALGRLVQKAARRMEEAEEVARANGLQREGALTEYPLPNFEGEHAVFAGRADRVDLWRNTGLGISGAVLVDYKLGASDRYRKSLQLAAYAHLMELEGEHEVEGFGFLGHRDARFRGNWSEAMAPVYKGSKSTERDVSPDVAIEGAAQAVAALDASVGDGHFAADYDSEGCQSCQYGIICRRAERRGASEDGGNTDEPDEFNG